MFALLIRLTRLSVVFSFVILEHSVLGLYYLTSPYFPSSIPLVVQYLTSPCTSIHSLVLDSVLFLHLVCPCDHYPLALLYGLQHSPDPYVSNC
jgi:hypothetical protein